MNIRLGDLLTDLRSGFASGKRSADGILQVRMHNVETEGSLTWKSECRVPWEEMSSDQLLLVDGDVLFNCTNSQELVGKTAIFRELSEPVTFSNHFFRLRTDRSRLEPSFLARWLGYLFSRGVFSRGCVRWVNQATFRSERLLEMVIDLPAIGDQKRISEILDKADAIRSKREEAIKVAHEFLRSLFLDMFGDPVRNPKGFPQSFFGDQLSFLQYGPRFYNQPYSKSGIRTVRITDLDNSGSLAFDDMPYIEVEEKAIQAFSLQPGELIFARSGATVGKTALLDKDSPPCIAGAYFLRMRFASSVLPQFVRMVLVSRSIQRIIVNQSRQSAQQNFSGPALRRLPLPVPPLQLQQKFVELDGCLRKQIKLLSRQVANSVSLCNVLTHRAFRGEL